MKKLPLLIFASLCCLLFINPQTQFAAVFPKSEAKRFAKKSARYKTGEQTALWQPISEDSLDFQSRGSIAPEKYLVFRLSNHVLTELLTGVRSEFTESAREKSVIIELPMPDGSLKHFQIEESSVLEPDLAARFPEIKSYKGQGIEDTSLTTRFDWTPQGFHALILSGNQTINIEPANTDGNDKSLYISYFGEDLKGTFECLVKDFKEDSSAEFSLTTAPQIAVGTTLRNYRIAVATTFEYTQTYGSGTVAGTVSSLNTWLNGANLIYERELSIHLNLVNDTDVIYSADRGFTSTTDPYDNASVGTMLDQVRPNLRDNVGEANYDLGHVFGALGGPGAGGSGIAFVGVACSNSNYNSLGAIKGGGSTLLGGTVGNVTALGLWVHELGHQFGANHNFNGSLGNCSGPNRSDANSFETGSGSTIMGYSGTCGADNITSSRDMRFHAKSYEAINDYIADGGICFIGAATGNSPPTVSGGLNFNIPKNTPFTLTATGSDPNGDALTYNWEQIDAGNTSYPQNGTSASYTDAFDPSSTTRPIFRPFPSTSSPSRTFPSLTYILNNANDPPDLINNLQTAEELPRIGRTLNFRVTARDNHLSGGGVNDDSVVITVDGSSGPFNITSPIINLSLIGNSSQIVAWNVNNTNVAPISAANVRISLSTDGGQTFPIILAANTPNDGTQLITVPNLTTSAARIKIEAVGNIFFDISDNFAIALQTTAASVAASGKVVTAQGRGIKNAAVTMTDSSGGSRTATTNAFGHFSFADLSAGQTYVFIISHKQYTFSNSSQQVFNLTEDRDDVIFRATSQLRR